MARSGKVRNIKFWKYYKEWVETYKLGAVRKVTYERYLSVGQTIKELVPNLMLGSLSRMDLQRLLNKFGETHQKKTVKDFYHHLHPAIQDAVYEGWIKKDPCYKIKITSQKPTVHRNHYLEYEEVQRLEKVFRQDQTGFGDFFDFLLKTGLRYAEALGITPNDVDEQKMTISINKAFWYKKGNAGFAPTKNKYSVRTIQIDDTAMDDLRKHMAGCGDDDSIWVNWKVNHLKLSVNRSWNFHNTTANEYLKRFCRQAGATVITVHGLRHTHASLLIANHVSVQSVAKRLGHSSPEITQRVYIHLLDKLEREDNQTVMNIMQGL